MSASIHWKPVTSSPTVPGVLAPSKFQEQMSRAGLELPVRLGKSEVAVLRGMAAGWGDQEHNPYQSLMDLIDQHGEIEIWAEY